MSKRAKIAWHCRRGMRELDVLLERFLDRHYDTLSDDDKAAFERLLDRSNDDLIDWFMSGVPPEDEEMARLVRAIRSA